MSIRIHDSQLAEFTPQSYVLDPPLQKAVELAIALGQPLLLTGEPGTGKTRLADRVAFELAQDQRRFQFLEKPLIFNTKTTSQARDLFYTYDALSHFQAANVKREETGQSPQTADFIELQALGLAIANTDPARLDRDKVRSQLETKPRSSVVLIDEIDKAPRDFTNDLLFEIERNEFRIQELNYALKRQTGQRIVVIMTSNSEKNLPDAFLRRCVFYHIPFPSPEKLLEIARIQLGGATRYTDKLLQELIDRFQEVRQKSIRKPPATAELIGWLRMLEVDGYIEAPDDQRLQYLRDNLSLLVKTREDLEAVRNLM